jgi:hypothetical protein
MFLSRKTILERAWSTEADLKKWLFKHTVTPELSEAFAAMRRSLEGISQIKPTTKNIPRLYQVLLERRDKVEDLLK